MDLLQMSRGMDMVPSGRIWLYLIILGYDALLSCDIFHEVVAAILARWLEIFLREGVGCNFDGRMMTTIDPARLISLVAADPMMLDPTMVSDESAEITGLLVRNIFATRQTPHACRV